MGEEHLASRAFIQLSAVHYDLAEPGKAVAAVRDALGLIDHDQEPELVQVAYENLALYVAEAGDPQRAREILLEHPASEERPDRFRLMREWKECLIASKLGEHSVATSRLEQVRSRFAELRDAPKAACATLDLAMLYCEAGQVTAMQDTAAQALPLLLPLGLPDEALASLMLLQDAAQTQAVTLTLLRQVQKDLAQPSTWKKG